jgi:hypothetical protein
MGKMTTELILFTLGVSGIIGLFVALDIFWAYLFQLPSKVKSDTELAQAYPQVQSEPTDLIPCTEDARIHCNIDGKAVACVIVTKQGIFELAEGTWMNHKPLALDVASKQYRTFAQWEACYPDDATFSISPHHTAFFPKGTLTLANTGNLDIIDIELMSMLKTPLTLTEILTDNHYQWHSKIMRSLSFLMNNGYLITEGDKYTVAEEQRYLI